MKFSQLLQQLQITDQHSLLVDPAHDPVLTGLAAIDEAQPGSLSYIEGGKFANQIHHTGASAVILPQDAKLQQQASQRQIAWISTAEPKLLFAKAVPLFYQPFQPEPGIHPTAIIHPTAQLGQEVSVGAYSVIQANVKIGNGVCIHPSVVVYPDVQIGDRTVLHAGCVIHERTQIGADCVIHSGAVIGAEGFGFVPAAEGWVKLEQSGITVLEDRVEVGCNSTVDRPAVGETRIGYNSKLDNLVHVGHNCRIGQNCILAAQVGMAGGGKTGNWVILGGQVGVANQATIGDRVQAGAKAGLHGAIAPGSIMMGSPASPYRTFLKASAIYNRLPDMHQSLRQLQQQVEELQQQIAQLTNEDNKHDET
ncbi:UDP-3-O-(3-hydroxymyristoyl)glucosamine N-acyltransferase [Leptolyngbya sp. NK1-12]|uniref:UDP-3-O-acylglucosamine N-acyltransferase n=1 Tax=Leptolyngbya sp. NK1-12 TaxID=2547451 RepID=A0AA96WDQ0_9CYAN|nr:UDP-3-O-(3-hydroxymyristoyl)glucosamine N-acyltransferase [Leptolyngbya sp. NK1-12]WNZ23378.1 UDP-3-O-(3-hydroxymyristoyl)glucosamine N-acyltransferase [Leptolyngbya sp. NK1-12]